MAIQELYLQNEFLITLIYSIILVASSAAIYLKTIELYRLSQHRGIKYFANAFLFFAIAFGAEFIYRAIIIINLPLGPLVPLSFLLVFIYALLMAAFYLLFSLVWKRFQARLDKKEKTLSQSRNWFSIRVYSVHAIAVMLAVLEILTNNLLFLFVPVIVMLVIATVVSYKNYKKSREQGRHNFRQMFFISIVLALVGYLVNFIGEQFIFPTYPEFEVYGMIITAIVVLIVLYGVFKATRKR